MSRTPVTVVTLGVIASDPGLAAWLVDELSAELDAEVVHGPGIPIGPAWHDLEPGRLRSNRIVDDLAAAAPRGSWTLALVDAHLAAPGREIVFGEATLGGPVALVTVAPLHSDEIQLLRLRALKEALHEVGHLAGLPHCSDDRCVMHPAGSLRLVDRRTAAFCDACGATFRTSPPP